MLLCLVSNLPPHFQREMAKFKICLRVLLVVCRISDVLNFNAVVI